MDIEQYSRLAIQYYRPELPQLLLKHIPNKFKTILDVGCGDGSTIFALINHKTTNTAKIFAVDLSQIRINLIKKSFGKKVHATTDNAENLKTIKSGSIDILISEQVIEHVDDHKMVNSIIRVTKRGSIIFLSTVIKKRSAWYFYKNCHNQRVLDPTHLREYPNSDSIINMFDQNKFNVISHQQQIFRFPLLDIIFRLLKQHNRNIYSSIIYSTLRKFTLPIPGYYKFEIVLSRK